MTYLVVWATLDGKAYDAFELDADGPENAAQQVLDSRAGDARATAARFTVYQVYPAIAYFESKPAKVVLRPAGPSTNPLNFTALRTRGPE